MGAGREEKFGGKTGLNIDGRLPMGVLKGVVFHTESCKEVQMEREGARTGVEVQVVGGPSRR